MLHSRRRSTRTSQNVRRNPPPDPTSILGADLAAHLRVEEWTAASWPDVSGNLTISQATANRQFSAAKGINNRDTARSDGNDDYMTGVMSSGIAQGTRPYIFLLVRLVADAGGSKSLFNLYNQATFSNMSITTATVSTVRVMKTFQTKTGPAAYSFAGTALHLRPTIVEVGYPDSTTDHFFLDGVVCNTVASGTPVSAGCLDALDALDLSNNSGLTIDGNWDYRDVVIARSITPAQRAAIYRYLQYRMGVA